MKQPNIVQRRETGKLKWEEFARIHGAISHAKRTADEWHKHDEEVGNPNRAYRVIDNWGREVYTIHARRKRKAK